MRLIPFQRSRLSYWPSALDQWDVLRDEINRLFEAPFNGGGFDALNQWAPALDVYEDKDNLVVKAELPGMKREEIEISLHENTLTISGERKQETKEEGAETSREERFYGRFQRAFTLPKKVDGAGVKAAYKDGILTVTLPKAPEAKPRQIQIKA